MKQAQIKNSYTGETLNLDVEGCKELKKQAFKEFNRKRGMNIGLSDLIMKKVKEQIKSVPDISMSWSYDIYRFIVYELEVY